MSQFFPLPHIPHVIHFLSLGLRIPLRHKGSGTYSQSSCLLIKYIVLFSLLQKISFPSTTSIACWSFTEMYYSREKLLLFIKVFFFLNFKTKDKMHRKRGKTVVDLSTVQPLDLSQTQSSLSLPSASLALRWLPPSPLSWNPLFQEWLGSRTKCPTFPSSSSSSLLKEGINLSSLVSLFCC